MKRPASRVRSYPLGGGPRPAPLCLLLIAGLVRYGVSLGRGSGTYARSESPQYPLYEVGRTQSGGENVVGLATCFCTSLSPDRRW